jgi:hypothetical protein
VTIDDDLRPLRLQSAHERQRAAHLTLGRLLNRTEGQDLDPLEWRNPGTGVLVGAVQKRALSGEWYTFEQALAVHEAWTAFLGATPDESLNSQIRHFRVSRLTKEPWLKDTTIALMLSWEAE